MVLPQILLLQVFYKINYMQSNPYYNAINAPVSPNLGQTPTGGTPAEEVTLQPTNLLQSLLMSLSGRKPDYTLDVNTGDKPQTEKKDNKLWWIVGGIAAYTVVVGGIALSLHKKTGKK